MPIHLLSISNFKDMGAFIRKVLFVSSPLILVYLVALFFFLTTGELEPNRNFFAKDRYNQLIYMGLSYSQADRDAPRRRNCTWDLKLALKTPSFSCLAHGRHIRGGPAPVWAANHSRAAAWQCCHPSVSCHAASRPRCPLPGIRKP